MADFVGESFEPSPLLSEASADDTPGEPFAPAPLLSEAVPDPTPVEDYHTITIII